MNYDQTKSEDSLLKRIFSAILSVFKTIGLGIYNGFKKVGLAVINFFVRFGRRFKEGSIHTKISHFIMGYGNIARKQYIKGALFLLIQIGFFAFMIFSPETNNTPMGYKALGNLITLGTKEGDIFNPTDNSMLMLLFGVLTIGGIIIFLFSYNSNIKSSLLTDELIAKGNKPRNFKEDLKELLDSKFHLTMLTPSIIAITIFTILPTIFMILIAFTNYDNLHTPGQQLIDWVGLQNFTDVFTGRGEISLRFLPVLSWTLIWAFFATFTNYIMGIILALLINNKLIKGKKMWRTIFILTIAIPQFISLLAVRNLLSELGPVNTFLVNVGILDEPMNLLGGAKNANTARVAVIIINLWVGVPYTMLMTSGILMNIPSDLYEAAEIDGASGRQKFLKITMPYIIFITTPYIITSFVGNITSFNIIFLLTGGGPDVVVGAKAGGTDLLVTWLYKLTIDERMYNLGSVIGIFTFIITATGTLLAYRRSKAYKDEGAFQG